MSKGSLRNATLPSKSLMLDLACIGTLHGQDLAEDRKFTRRESPDGVQAVGNCSAISLKGSYDHTDTRECADFSSSYLADEPSNSEELSNTHLQNKTSVKMKIYLNVAFYFPLALILL